MAHVTQGRIRENYLGVETPEGRRTSKGRIGVTGTSAGEARQVEPIAARPDVGRGEEFSLVLGGPLYQLLLRSRLIRPPFGNLG